MNRMQKGPSLLGKGPFFSRPTLLFSFDTIRAGLFSFIIVFVRFYAFRIDNEAIPWMDGMF